MDRLVLASSSPRRQELIKLLGIPVRVVSSRYEEPLPPTHPVDIAEYVQELAVNKAIEVSDRCPGELVIGADTLVTLSDERFAQPLGKPINLDDARRMLNLLSGSTHWVYTGIALCRRHEEDPIRESAYSRTGVTFRPLSANMIEAYLKTGESMDKAGAYGAQGRAAPLIEGFQGDYFNVVGLPLCSLGMLLERVGVTWLR